jgi:hypothetical protein
VWTPSTPGVVPNAPSDRRIVLGLEEGGAARVATPAQMGGWRALSATCHQTLPHHTPPAPKGPRLLTNTCGFWLDAWRLAPRQSARRRAACARLTLPPPLDTIPRILTCLLKKIKAGPSSPQEAVALTPSTLGVAPNVPFGRRNVPGPEQGGAAKVTEPGRMPGWRGVC